MKINWHITLFILFNHILLFNSSSFAAEDSKVPKLFSDANEMKVTFSGPWYTIGRNRKKDAFYPVKLTYTDADGQQHTIDAKVSPRGITRRLRVCKFPPLKIHFDKEKMKGTEFRGNKSLKLVTYCQSNSKYEQYYIKEFLIYRIYNLITEFSFRVKPMMIEYKDSEKTGNSITRFSFLIEDIDDVAKRNGMEKLEIAKVPVKQLDPVLSSQFSLFQYLIGNLDWAATGGPNDDRCCHNSRLIGTGTDLNPKYGIPYDFDSSGLVDAHYAAPPDGLRVRNVRQRLFRGFCRYNDTLTQAAEQFREKKTDILALFENDPHLSNKTRQKALAYIEGFYTILNDPNRYKKYLTDNCRGKNY